MSTAHLDEHGITKELALKPSCHDAKDGEAHLCSCKKKKKDALSLRTHHQTMDRPNLALGFAVPAVIFYTIDESPSTLLDGKIPTLLRPPRT